MIRHHHECVQFNQWEMVRDILLTALGDFASIVQSHFTVHHMPEQAFSVRLHTVTKYAPGWA